MDWCWEGLANAIILQAVDDYRYARGLLAYAPDHKELQHTLREVERFFRSGWFCLLTDVDGGRLLEDLKMEVA